MYNMCAQLRTEPVHDVHPSAFIANARMTDAARARSGRL